MGRQKRFNQGPQKHSGEDRLVCMLDQRRMDYFRYDAKEIFERNGIEEKVSKPMLASIVSRGTRNSIDEAKEYVDEKISEGVLDEDIGRALKKLINRYKKWR